MGLREEIVPYTDGNGYVAPNLVTPGTMRGSDNGTMFSSECAIILHKNGESNNADETKWEQLIYACMQKPGLTVRAPGDKAIDAPDNLYAILAAATVLDKPYVAQDILRYGREHWGFYDPTDIPGLKGGAFQWRQPQLLFAMLCASNANRLHHLPLAVYTALVIATSCWRTQIGDTDSRRLSWLLIQSVKESSWLCYIASKIWYSRLYKDYGSPNAMKKVAGIYYKDSHPFMRYFID